MTRPFRPVGPPFMVGEETLSDLLQPLDHHGGDLFQHRAVIIGEIARFVRINIDLA